jgi:uncharacterized protein YjdB
MRELSGAEVPMAPPAIARGSVSPLPLSRTVATVSPIPMAPGVEVRQSAEAVSEVQDTCGRLVIVPGEGALAVGQVVCLMAFRRKDDGEVRPAAEVDWSSSDPSVLRIARDGEATAHRPGVARITASSAGQAAEVSFQVSRVDVAQVRITPGIASLGAGEAVRLEAQAIDRLGMSLRGRIVTWSSSQPEVAAVGPDGVLRGLRPGTVRVSAAIGGGLAWTEVRVTPVRVQGVKLEPGALLLRVGESAAVRATVQAIRGGTVAGVPVEWQSSDPAIAAITQDGMVSGVRFGIARIAASAGGRRATIPVEVRASGSVSSPRPPLGTT